MSEPLPDAAIVDLLLNGHCAAFALAAWEAAGRPDIAEGAGISILVDDDGEPNFDPDEEGDDTRCAIHAYLSLADGDYDAEGKVDPETMADRYGLVAYSIDGPYHPEHFLDAFCGADGPFTVDDHYVAMARDLIARQPHLIGRDALPSAQAE